MIVRRERASDVAAVRQIHAAAFARRVGDEPAEEPMEARLLDALRACDGWIDALSWVAEIDGVVVAHGCCTRGVVGGVDGVGGVGLGPIAVRPDVQRAGAGSAVVHALVGAADALGEPFVALLGDPAYYSRFGFVASTSVGIEPPDAAWGVHFQVLALSSHRPGIRGTFAYAEPFTTVV